MADRDTNCGPKRGLPITGQFRRLLRDVPIAVGVARPPDAFSGTCGPRNCFKANV